MNTYAGGSNVTAQGMTEPVAVNDDPYADEERIPPPRKYHPPVAANIGVTAAQPGNGEGKWEKGVDMDMDIDVSVEEDQTSSVEQGC
jgi:hypothetical protein